MDKLKNFALKAQKDAWVAMKGTYKIKGYEYYEMPQELKYRYPAPGSCAMDPDDHFNLYKDDWKRPFRQSEYNIRAIELQYDDDDPRQARSYISKPPPTFDPSHKREGHYDQAVLNEAIPECKSEVFDNDNLDEMQKELLAGFEDTQNQMKLLRQDFAPGQQDYDDDYNQFNQNWNNRTATGMDNSPRMKECFVELEYWVEEVIGKKRINEGKVGAYKGTTKKWQVLDDACFDRDQIEKMQSAVSAPTPEQLEIWKEKCNEPIMAPFNNKNIKKWRDEPLAIENADFDAERLVEERNVQKNRFLERYDRPKEISENH